MKKNKFMIVSPNLLLGGAERVSISICNLLAEAGESVCLVVLNANGPLKITIHKKVQIIELISNKASKSALELRKVIIRENPSIVISNTVRMNISLLLGTLFGKKEK